MSIGILFLFNGVALVHCAGEFVYINQLMTWADAQQYCRERYTDLATIENEDDLQRINQPSSTWIGLFDDPASWKKAMTSDSNSWKWSDTGTTSRGGFQSWALYEPNNSGSAELCVYIENGQWFDFRCEAPLYFICYAVETSGTKEYILVEIALTWTSAQSYCRTHHHDLAMIESSAENQAVVNVQQAHSVWIGLYRTSWRWSDGNPSTFRKWSISEPNNNGGSELCVAQRSGYIWNDYSCDHQHAFVCQVVKISITKIKVTIKTTALMSDLAIQDNILKLLQKRFGFGVSLSWSIAPVKEEEETCETCASSDINFCRKGNHDV